MREVREGLHQCHIPGGCTHEEAVDGWLPATGEYFHILKSAKSGFHSYCRIDTAKFKKALRCRTLVGALGIASNGIPARIQQKGWVGFENWRRIEYRVAITLPIFRRQKGKCPICLLPLKWWLPRGLSVDRIDSSKGYEEPGNIQLMCEKCNSRKSDNTPETAAHLVRHFWVSMPEYRQQLSETLLPLLQESLSMPISETRGSLQVEAGPRVYKRQYSSMTL